MKKSNTYKLQPIPKFEDIIKNMQVPSEEWSDNAKERLKTAFKEEYKKAIERGKEANNHIIEGIKKNYKKDHIPYIDMYAFYVKDSYEVLINSIAKAYKEIFDEDIVPTTT